MPAIETIITVLEMRERRGPRIPAPSGRKLALMRAEAMPVAFYRYLYDAVGRIYHWVDRKRLSDAELEAIIRSDQTEIWILYAGGVPAGYFELALELPQAVRFAYFGLVPDFHGQGLGRFLLAAGLDAAWARQPERVTIETCTLDHPAALQLYQKHGFVAVTRRVSTVETIDA